MSSAPATPQTPLDPGPSDSGAPPAPGAATPHAEPMGGSGASERPIPAEVTAREAATVAALRKPSVMDRIDRFISRLSAKSHFWQRVTSLVWLPYAFKSGIKMRRVDERTFAAVLPYRRFNRNWYNAMAGAALLANSEIAGGMYVFGICGGEYTVVCKNLDYKFLRPCFGPAVYKITTRENLQELLATGNEFNITLDMDVVQQSVLPEPVRRPAEKMLPKAVGERVASKEKRVGKCVATFHVTPKAHQQSKGRQVRRVI